MAKVYTFPVKKELESEVVNCLHEIADAYVRTLNYALTTMSSDNVTNEELNDIREMVEAAYINGLCKAICKMEEEL